MTQDMTLTGNESPHSCGAASVIPHTALVLSQIDSAHGQTMLVAQHKIYETPQGWTLGSADVLDPAGVMDIVRRMDNEAAMHSGPQYLPPNLLAQDDDLLIWHVPATVRPMFFLMPHSRRAITLDVVWPSLVFCARGGSLRLFATATTKRPEPTTPLFQAPLMNHDPVRGLCFGSVPRPQRADLSSVATYESAVYQTNFTHIWGEWPLADRFAKGKPDNPGHEFLAFYEQLAARKAKRFPKSALRDAGMTLGDLIARAG